jgi:hypothetical protein
LDKVIFSSLPGAPSEDLSPLIIEVTGIFSSAIQIDAARAAF